MYDRRQVLDEFANICSQVKIEYDVFLSLFDNGEQQNKLLQETAPFFFGGLFAIMRKNVYVGFCTMTDPAGSGKRVNLTTNYLLTFDWPSDTRTKLDEVNARLMIFRKYVEPARSKRIAHADLRAQMDKGNLGGFPPGADELFFKDLEEFLTAAYQAVNGGPFYSIWQAQQIRTG